MASPLPGTVLTLNVKAGDAVNEGDTVLILEAMKMETEVKADRGGTIQSILVSEGATVQTGDPLMTIG